MKETIFLTPRSRAYAAECLRRRPDGHMLVLQEPTRTLQQNAMLHSLFTQIAKQAQFRERSLTAIQWKTLMVSAHAVATGIGSDMVPGLEGEWVNIRESTAQMSVKRLNSLIEYVLAWCANSEIRIAADPSMEEFYAKG